MREVISIQSDKLVSKSVMVAGNSTASNTVSNQMVNSHQIRQSVSKMMLSTHSSQKQALESTFHVPFSLISNQQLLTKFAQVHTANSSTQNNSSQVRKMLLTTTLVVTTQSVRKSSISHSIESVSSLINAQVSKASLSSTHSVVVQVLALVHSSSKDFQSITVRSQSLNSQFIHPHKFQQPSLNHTTQFLLHTL